MQPIPDLIRQLTLEEKAALCSGQNFWFLKALERLGIPAIMLTDGPHGLRKQSASAEQIGLNQSVPATCFPTASALAATWNRDLVFQVGQALAEECLQEGVSVILGPGANIKRSPLCGRNFEYFSEDPFLSGEIAKSHILGVQSLGIGTSLKHFALNNQEHSRMTTNSVVDARAMREIYLAGFERAVRGAQPWTVMCSYNRINGTYACENKALLSDILREEWGFEGLVVTDWGAMNEVAEAVRAGTDLEMPGVENGNTERLIAAVRSGKLEEAALDRAVERVLTLIQKSTAALRPGFTYDPQAHHLLARRAAAEGAVLLKNEDSLLPLQNTGKVGLIGRFAREPRYQGAGSSLINPTRLENLYDELAKLIGEERLSYAPGYNDKGSMDDTLLQEALDAASRADTVILCVGLTDMDEVEGLDREHMRLPAGHDALIAAVCAAHPRCVVVLSNGSPVEMPWLSSAPAVLEAYLGGQAGAGAAADILTGRVNPSGKLAESFPIKLEDTPARPYPGGPQTVEYRESIYVGYRYYDSAGAQVLFPFGHGLSYTKFEYSNLKLLVSGERVIAAFTLKNSGLRTGKESAQLYVRDLESSVFRPEKELKGFIKVELQPGEERELEIELDPRAFAFFDAQSCRWVSEAGGFEILVGASSRDIRLRAVVARPASGMAHPRGTARLEAYLHPTQAAGFPRESFEELLGSPLPPNLPDEKGQFSLNTPLADMKGTLIGAYLFRAFEKGMQKMNGPEKDTPTSKMMNAMPQEMPLRTALMMGGGISREKLLALVTMMNGKFFKGLRAFLKAP
ncbi:MAG: glycoside hydrolase family 3 C-terminal domain-containing protein [Anaerolineaceae bacterium]